MIQPTLCIMEMVQHFKRENGDLEREYFKRYELFHEDRFIYTPIHQTPSRFYALCIYVYNA